MPAVPTQQPPPVQRLRIRYAKRGRLRFTSHRDFSRAFERAIRRAGLPVAYTSGFSPHPRISYANASPTGAASEAEYLEIGLASAVDPALVRSRLDDALPAGLDIVEVLDVASAPAGPLANRLEASLWRVELRGVATEDATEAVERFLAEDVVEVQRMMKNGSRTFDCRGAVVRVVVRAESIRDIPCAILDVVVRHGTPTVRPDDILAGLRQATGLVPPEPWLATRLAQGPLDAKTGNVADPLGTDRDASWRTATADG